MADVVNMFERKRQKCYHRGTYLYCETEQYLECKDCGEKLNPYWVINQLIKRHDMWVRAHQAYEKAKAELEQRLRTKCVHCKQFTPIKLGALTLL